MDFEETKQEIEQIYGELTFAAAIISRLLNVLGSERSRELIWEATRSVTLASPQGRIGAERFKGRILKDFPDERAE